MARRGAGRIYSSVNSQSSHEGFCDDIVLDDFQPRQLSIALVCLGLTFPVPDLHCHVYVPAGVKLAPISKFRWPSDESRRSLSALFGPSPVTGRPRSWADYIALLLRILNFTRRPFIHCATYGARRTTLERSCPEDV